MKLAPFEKIRWSLFAVFLCNVSLPAQSKPIEAVEKAATEWVKIRAETTRIQTEWSTQRPLLESTANGLKERAQTLETKRDYLQAKTAKDRGDLAKLETANSSAAAEIQATEAQLKVVDARLLQLRPSLPPRLSAALELPFRSLASSGLTVSERMQLTMTFLNRCIQFNRGISCEEEVLNPGGEPKAQLFEVIYWGLGHGYALDRARNKVWFGSPGSAGWQWESVPDAAKQVTELISIYQGKGEPVFVEVPARVKNLSLDSSKN